MIKSQRIERLGDQRQQNNALQIFKRVARIHRADGNAIGKQGKSQPADQAHFGHARKEHLAGMIDQHEQAGEQADQAGVLIGFDVSRADHGRKQLLKPGRDGNLHGILRISKFNNLSIDSFSKMSTLKHFLNIYLLY